MIQGETENRDSGRGGQAGFDVREWFRTVAELTGRGETVEFVAQGGSMRPVIRPGVDTVRLQRAAEYVPGDMVLAYCERPEGVMLHRIVKVTPQGYMLMGDANLVREEFCTADNIVGKVTEIIRNGRDVSDTSLARMYRKSWRIPKRLRSFLVRIMIHLYP